MLVIRLRHGPPLDPHRRPRPQTGPALRHPPPASPHRRI